MANALMFRPLTWSSITAGTTEWGYSVDNLSPLPVPRMGRVWRNNGDSATETLTIDLGEDTEFDTIALFGIGEENGTPSASWQWAIDIATEAQGAFTGTYWSGSAADLLAGTELPVSGFGKALWQAPSGAPASGRYVRINFSALGTAYLQVALLAIGAAFQPGRNFAYGAARGVRDLGRLDYSPRGVVSHRAGAKLRGFGLTFRSVTRQEVEDQVDRLFERVGNTEPVVLVTDPSAHAQRQNRMGIGHLTGDLGSVHRVPGFFQADVNFVAVD